MWVEGRRLSIPHINVDKRTGAIDLSFAQGTVEGANEITGGFGSVSAYNTGAQQSRPCPAA